MQLNDSSRELVRLNHNLIYKCISKYKLNVDEFYDIAAIALCKAAATFDESKGFKFSTYAYKVIENEILQQLRKDKNRNKLATISLEETLYTNEDGGEVTVADILATNDNMFEVKETQVDFMNILDRLTYTELETLYYLLKLGSKVDVARALGKSRQTITNTINRIRVKTKHGSIIRRNLPNEASNIKRDILRLLEGYT